MRFSKALVAATALFLAPLAACQDDDLDNDVEPEEEATSSVSINIPRPTFTPTTLKAPFLEQFTDDWEKRWQPSNAKKQDKTDEDWAYIGTWAAEEPFAYKGMEGDKGLVLKDKAAHHAISAKFPSPIDNKGKTLVVQYEVKLQDGLDCGGAYIKLLQDNKALHAEEFSNASPYIIMFGPDKCGATNKVHFIYRHKNPVNGEYEEKHLAESVDMRNEKTTTLYRLVIHPNQTYSIDINGEQEQNNTFFAGFEPSIIPPKEIDDPDDKKPEDWVDEAKIADPDAKKPDDWDEDQPYEIPDEDAVKPDDWLEDEPVYVPDPDAKKPDDWDDEEDGDWSPPEIPNPKCEDVSGCGPWERPPKKNPLHKGQWKAPLIDNPAYKGVWKAKRIANPNWFTTETPADLEPMGGIGMELWTMTANILFDNIYIGHSIEDADKLKEETFDVKAKVEQKIMDAEDKKDEKKPPKIKKPLLDPELVADPVGYIREKVELFITLAKKDPVDAIKVVPEVAGGLGLVAVTLIALIVGGLGVGSQSPQVQEAAGKAKDAAVNAKDKASDAVSSGAEKVQSEVNKRTTRSAGTSD